jgi:hypothetical protein
MLIQGIVYHESRIIFTALVDPDFHIASDMEIDHWNWDPLYNAPSNLRALTCQQNIWNRGLSANNTSGFLGVIWDKSAGKWRARARGLGSKERQDLGRFTSKVEAAITYDNFIRPIRQQFGIYNFPQAGERGLPPRIDTVELQMAA